MKQRLGGWGGNLSRQAGGRAAGGEGIGGRGPGETKIETDRRRINTKIAKLRRELKAMQGTRDTKRQDRKRNEIPSVAIAGYTNTGKSSLLKRLTDAGVMVEVPPFEIGSDSGRGRGWRDMMIRGVGGLIKKEKEK